MNGDKATPTAVAKSRPRKTTKARSPVQSVPEQSDPVQPDLVGSSPVRSVPVQSAEVADVESKVAAVAEPAPEVAARDSNAEKIAPTGVTAAIVEKSEEGVNMDKQQPKSNGDKAPPASDPAEQFYQGVNAFNRDYMETVIMSANAFAMGCEALGNEWMNYAQAAVEDGMETSKALMSCKSVDEAVEINSGYATNVLNRYVTESAKLSELTVKLANGAIEPLNSGFVVAARDLTRTASSTRKSAS